MPLSPVLASARWHMIFILSPKINGVYLVFGAFHCKFYVFQVYSACISLSEFLFFAPSNAFLGRPLAWLPIILE